ncbi:hypothetical protein L6452_40264 [Arctium lappa]|uniref:Uncharacterized protein n=1 Tax=Arctium lappa TaxID=4217 RepID=A0ACB8XLS9_ARCLA|nr:hypothetical protein L6452_40264 [Arctium lappa]
MSLSGFLFAFKIWILETFPMTNTYYILTTRMPRAVRWARSSTVIGSHHAHNLMDVSTEDRMPRDRLVPTLWEESQEWYTESHRWFSSTAWRRLTKRVRVTQDVDEEHEDLERRQAEKWASDRAYQESLERRIAEVERQFSAWQGSGAAYTGLTQGQHTQHMVYHGGLLNMYLFPFA